MSRNLLLVSTILLALMGAFVGGRHDEYDEHGGGHLEVAPELMEMVYATEIVGPFSINDNSKLSKRQAKPKKNQTNNKKATGKILITSLESIGRVTNAIEMENKMIGNPKATKTIVDELANRDQSLTKEKLGLKTVSELPKTLNQFVSVAKTHCANDGCSKFDDFAKGFNILSSIDGLNVSSEIFKEGSTWNVYTSIIENLMSLFPKIDELSKGLSGGFADQDKKDAFFATAGAKIKEIIGFPNILKQMKEINFNQLKADIASVLASEQVKEAFKQAGVDIGKWENSLKPIRGKIKAFQSSFTKKVVTEYRSSIEQLLTTYQKLFNHFEKKVETSGFPNGASDLVKLLEDVKNEFFADHLQVKEGNLKNLFPIVLQLNEQFKTILDMRGKVEKLDVVRSVQNIKTLFEGALAELEAFNTISSLFDCDNMFDRIVKGHWEGESSLIVKIEKQMKEFIGKLKLPEIKMLPELLKVFNKTLGEREKALEEFGKKSEAQGELNSFKTQLQAANFDSLTKLFGGSFISTISNSVPDLQKPENFLTCMPNQAALTNAKNLFGNEVSMSKLQSLETIKVDGISSFGQLIEPYWDGVEKILSTSSKKPKNKAAANSSLADGTSRKLNEAIHIFVGLKSAASSPVFKKFIEQTPNIDAFISTLPDSPEKIELLTLFNDATKKSMKWASKTGEELIQKQFTSGIDGIRSLVKHPLQIDGNVDIELRRISRFLVDLGAPFPKKEDSAVLEQMLMEFASGSVTLKEGKKTLEKILLYFIQLSDKDDLGAAAVSDKKDSESFWAQLVPFLIPFGSLEFYAVVIGLTSYYKVHPKLKPYYDKMQKKKRINRLADKVAVKEDDTVQVTYIDGKRDTIVYKPAHNEDEETPTEFLEFPETESKPDDNNQNKEDAKKVEIVTTTVKEFRKNEKPKKNKKMNKNEKTEEERMEKETQIKFQVLGAETTRDSTKTEAYGQLRTKAEPVEHQQHPYSEVSG
uniref:WSN domain-containing protein n=1 Tax=Caenorhabditis tropicalis TaxID=1561998 RepID=A0A1I7UJ66_9PELO